MSTEPTGERVEHERPADVHQRAAIGLLEPRNVASNAVSWAFTDIAAPWVTIFRVTVGAAPQRAIGG